MAFDRSSASKNPNVQASQPTLQTDVHTQLNSVQLKAEEQPGLEDLENETSRIQRTEQVTRSGHNFARVPVHAPGYRGAIPIQAHLAGQPDQWSLPLQASSPSNLSVNQGGEDIVQRAVQTRHFQPHPMPLLQPKLTLGHPNDHYEEEADRVAAQVVDQINNSASTPPIQRDMAAQQEELDEELQPKWTASGIQNQDAIAGKPVATDFASAINRTRGTGQPLDRGLQQSMGRAMGADFSRVKVHTDAHSDQLNQSIQAAAFTTGQDVFFRQGAYQPGSRGGQELIAHELAHVVQQRGPEAISRKFTAYGWSNPKQDKPLPLVQSEDDQKMSNLQLVTAIADDKQTLEALQEIATSYTYGRSSKDEKNSRDAKDKIRQTQIRDKADEFLKKPLNRKQALLQFSQASHDAGLVYKDSYPHIYFLWVNCITSQLEFLEKEEPSKSAKREKNHYDTIILGVGAAAGYYIMGNLATMTPDNTAIIGIDQPWDDKSPLARAIAINHENQAWTLNPTKSDLTDSDEKRSEALTEELEKVRKAVTWKKAYVKRTKEVKGEHEITISIDGKEETLYARMIVSALGGGAEMLRSNEVDARKDWKKKQENDGWQPVFTLNEFQRWLRDTGSDWIRGKRVVVVGANAGVDAAYTCTQAGGKLFWYVGPGMAYAAAMKNTDINWANVEKVYYGYGSFGSLKEDAKNGRFIQVDGSGTKAHEDIVKAIRDKDSDEAKNFDRVSGGKWAEVEKKMEVAKPGEADVYVNASGQDDTEIANVADIPSATVDKQKLKDIKKNIKDRKPQGAELEAVATRWARMRVVYSDGRISSKKLIDEDGKIDGKAPSESESVKAAKKRKQVSYDSQTPDGVWSELKKTLTKKAPSGTSFDSFNPNVVTARQVETDHLKEIIQAVAVYELGPQEDSIGSINQAKGGKLIIGAQARPYIEAAGYATKAVDQVEQIVDIGQITPTRQAIQQVTHLPVRGAMGSADYTYGTRDEIAATVAARGLVGIKADLITEAIIWSRSQPGLGQVDATKEERLTPAPRTTRMKQFWDAVLLELGQ